MSDQPIPPAVEDEQQEQSAPADAIVDFSVGVPGADADAPDKGVGILPHEEGPGLSEDLIERKPRRVTPKEREEILERLASSDLAKLDREVDKLYDKVAMLMSGDGKQATIAFELLRQARQYILEDPEQYAEAEFLVQQVQAQINRIERSIQQGRRYGLWLFLYQVVWAIALGVLALMTTVSGTAFAQWVAFFLGVPADSEGLAWAVLFLSTLAWGGIGGVTSAFWSLHYHISVKRDYDPVENMWYLSQPVLGMVLGGIIYLIMASGFLIVQVDLSGADAALGARLLPATVAVVAGFRQTVVLTLIERIVELVAPTQEEEESPPRPTI